MLYRKIYISLIALFCVGSASAARPGGEIAVSDIGMSVEGGRVHLSFTMQTERRTARGDRTLVVTPVIRNGRSTAGFEPVAVRGRKARVSASRRGSAREIDENRSIAAGESLRYEGSIPFEQWMRGAKLELDGLDVGCCTVREAPVGMLAAAILLGEPETFVQVVERLEAVAVPPTGELVAKKFSFVRPASELEALSNSIGGTFDYNMPLNMGKGLTADNQVQVDKFVDRNREGSLTIHFRQGRHDIDRTVSDNDRTLGDLVEAVREIESSGDSRVSRIVISGFASPEGSLAFNEKLAWDRAMAVKNYLLENTRIKGTVINVYNGSVDWQGLRELVQASSMAEKRQITDIIDNIPVWDARAGRGRHGELMRLGGGAPYRYMLQHLFPELRQAAFIKVFFEENE